VEFIKPSARAGDDHFEGALAVRFALRVDAGRGHATAAESGLDEEVEGV
jgi:hypothetical protein